MRSTARTRLAPLALGAALALVLFAIVGCGAKSQETANPAPTATAPVTGMTALDALPLAQSALSTTAPDAKLLVLQPAQAVTPTATPVWAYLFGDEKRDKTFLVVVADGEVVKATEYGTVGLSKTQWAEVPDVSEWKVDSDAAYATALSSSGQDGTSPYQIGLQTYVPKSEEQTQAAKPMMWYVYIGEETSVPVIVDARTGKVATQ
jgi:hypothetical protein